MVLDLTTPCKYANVGTNNKGYTHLHRKVYEEANGPIPSGHVVDHACHNVDANCEGGITCRHRACINELHLEAITYKENNARGQVNSAAVRARRRQSQLNTFAQTDRTPTHCSCGAGPFVGPMGLGVHQVTSRCETGGTLRNVMCSCGAGPYKATHGARIHAARAKCNGDPQEGAA